MDLVSDAFEVFLRQKTQKCVLATSSSFRLAVVHSHGQGFAPVTPESHRAPAAGKILVDTTTSCSSSFRTGNSFCISFQTIAITVPLHNEVRFVEFCTVRVHLVLCWLHLRFIFIVLSQVVIPPVRLNNTGFPIIMMDDYRLREIPGSCLPRLIDHWNLFFLETHFSLVRCDLLEF